MKSVIRKNWRLTAYNGRKYSHNSDPSSNGSSSQWTASTLSYLPIVPGSAGFGTDQYGGSGRHLANNNSAIMFVDDRGTGNTGSFDTQTRIGYGTTRYCVGFNAPRHVIPLVNGLLDYTVGGNSRNLQIPNSYMTFHGHCAPGHLVYRGALWVTNGTDICIMHVPVFQDLYGAGQGSGADCTTLLETPIPARVLWSNCAFWYGADECVDWFREISNAGLWQCIVANALVEGNHPEGVHNYGVIFGDQSTQLSLGRTIIAHCQARFPLSYAQSISVFNCLMYNWGDTGAQIAGDAEVTDTNIEHTLFVSGPDTSGDNAIRLYSSLLPGSRVYLNGNRGFGVAEASMVENDEGLTLQGSRITTAFQTGTGITPIVGEQDFAELVISHAGPRPASRTPLIQEVVDNIIARFVGGDTGGFALTPTSAGGFPSITNGSVLDPANPGAFWGGVPCPMNLATRNQVMASGYTRIEEWSHDVADSVMPSGWRE